MTSSHYYVLFIGIVSLDGDIIATEDLFSHRTSPYVATINVTDGYNLVGPTDVTISITGSIYSLNHHKGSLKQTFWVTSHSRFFQCTYVLIASFECNFKV